MRAVLLVAAVVIVTFWLALAVPLIVVTVLDWRDQRNRARYLATERHLAGRKLGKWSDAA